MAALVGGVVLFMCLSKCCEEPYKGCGPLDDEFGNCRWGPEDDCRLEKKVAKVVVNQKKADPSDYRYGNHSWSRDNRIMGRVSEVVIEQEEVGPLDEEENLVTSSSSAIKTNNVSKSSAFSSKSLESDAWIYAD